MPDIQNVEAVNTPDDYFYNPEQLAVIVKSKEITPFYLLRPTALPSLNLITEFLEKENVKITSQRSISEFEKMAPYIYPVKQNDENTYLWLMVTRAILPDTYNQSRALILEPDIEYQRVFNLKMAIRNMLGINEYRLKMKNGSEKQTDLHHFHAPDKDELAFQYNVLMHFSNLIE